MSYADFKASRLGRELDPILSSPVTIARMEALSRAGRPAVEAIGGDVARIAPDVDDTTKQHVGRFVRDVMAKRGWRPRRKARVAKGSPFSWGAVYAPGAAKQSATAELPERQSARERLEAVREILQSAGVKLPTVDEFLAERKKMWDS
jgi:nucleotide-binding universal stress UspA family protein